MKASCVLLRWYKSFNINYLGYPDRRHQVKDRPWTQLAANVGSAEHWRFVEIPIEGDITTIVGANESGKSHLLSAIAKVITGKGLPDERDRFLPFDRVDLCHYASVRNKNARAWPHLGVEFSDVSEEEWKKLAAAVQGNLTPGPRFTLVVAPDSDGNEAFLFTGAPPIPFPLKKPALEAVRQVLPTLRFIKSDVAMRDELPVDDLLASMGGNRSEDVPYYYSFQIAQNAAKVLKSLMVPPEGQQMDQKSIALIRQAVAGLNPLTSDSDDAVGSERHSAAALEAQLFSDVLGIDRSAVAFLADLPERNRSYADSLVSTWNDEIGRVLNLARYWQQDELFSLRMNFKRGTLFFELTDKTGYVYTFRERSSGLRYFLSYYIQAKALEMSLKKSNAIILMDEPDSYLSIIGQRSLLAVFESLVASSDATGGVQLMYTTHSPFLINRNFPRRIRLVRKGDGEEGTQYVDESRLRRYEPVRSALGIDCAQTLFMGSANLLLEGPTDQYLFAELIRAFSTPDKMHDLLDLNLVTIVSAESAPDVARVLQASIWGDEVFPATVVLFDNDEEGRKQRRRITGKANSGQERKAHGGSMKQIIKDEFVLLISDVLDRGVSQLSGAASADPQKGATAEGITQTIEDLVPVTLWSAAVADYLGEWCPTVSAERRSQICQHLQNPGSIGNLATTERAFVGTGSDEKLYVDKMGLLQAVVNRLHKALSSGSTEEWIVELRRRTIFACQKIKATLELSRLFQRRATGKQSVKRIAEDFLNQHPNRAGLFDVESLLARVSQEAELLAADGTALKEFVAGLADDISRLRAQGHDLFDKETWTRWRRQIVAIRDNPLEPEKSVVAITGTATGRDGEIVDVGRVKEIADASGATATEPSILAQAAS